MIGLYNGSGTLIGRHTYDAWGKLLDTELLDSSYGGIYSYVLELNPIRYRGYLYDTETGLYYCQSRYYDPEVGRWLNADSLLADVNLFRYCSNCPVNRSDSSGLDDEDDHEEMIASQIDPRNLQFALQYQQLEEQYIRDTGWSAGGSSSGHPSMKAVLSHFPDIARKWGYSNYSTHYPGPIGGSKNAHTILNSGSATVTTSVKPPVTSASTASIVSSAAAGTIPVIGKMSDLNNLQLGANEYKVADLLPDQGNPRANWQQNSAVLRNVMKISPIIKDASPYPMTNAGFLGAERSLLYHHGYRYDKSSSCWIKVF